MKLQALKDYGKSEYAQYIHPGEYTVVFFNTREPADGCATTLLSQAL